MFTISAIQSISYVLIGNFIFEIKGMTWSYWLILFTTACSANMMGLNISSGLNSVITIYILVPFLLIPQILFSGVLVKFDKLHKSLSNYEYVPIIGDLMPSRWAFEALAVEQFKNNKFQKTFFDLDQEISNTSYEVSFLIPKLEIKLNETLQQIRLEKSEDQAARNLDLLHDQTGFLQAMFPEIPFKVRNQLHMDLFDQTTADETYAYLNEVTNRLRSQLKEKKLELELLQQQMMDQVGAPQYTAFRNDYENTKLSDMVLNRNMVDKIIEVDQKLIRKREPVFMIPTSHIGRAQLYAPCKMIGNKQIDTLWFNVLVIWTFTLILYLMLYFDLLRKLLTYSGKKKWKNTT